MSDIDLIAVNNALVAANLRKAMKAALAGSGEELAPAALLRKGDTPLKQDDQKRVETE
jgi:hypothetical protein